jgi:drug/metabolite transporter (DMT)-like permease
MAAHRVAQTLFSFFRCISCLDVVGVLFAIVGIVLITRPRFVLSLFFPSRPLPPMDIPDLAYGLALLLAFIHMTSPYLIAIYSHIHWSSYILLRNIIAVLLSVSYLSFTCGWVEGSDAPVMTYLTNLVMGFFYNIVRVTELLALYELDQLGPGFAGFMVNLIYTLYIPLMVFFGYILYGEMITWIEGVGAAIILVTIISLTIVKFRLEKEKDADHGKIIDVKNQDSEGSELLIVK